MLELGSWCLRAPGAPRLPTPAQSAEHEPRSTDVHEAIGGAAGFDPGVAEILGGDEQFQVLRERAAEREVRDHHFSEAKLILVVFKLAADPAYAWCYGHVCRRAPK